MDIITRKVHSTKLSRPQPDSGPTGAGTPLVIVCVFIQAFRMNQEVP
jgi:hypothetical protein